MVQDWRNSWKQSSQEGTPTLVFKTRPLRATTLQWHSCAVFSSQSSCIALTACKIVQSLHYKYDHFIEAAERDVSLFIAQLQDPEDKDRDGCEDLGTTQGVCSALRILMCKLMWATSDQCEICHMLCRVSFSAPCARPDRLLHDGLAPAPIPIVRPVSMRKDWVPSSASQWCARGRLCLHQAIRHVRATYLVLSNRREMQYDQEFRVSKSGALFYTCWSPLFCWELRPSRPSIDVPAWGLHLH